MPFGIYPPSESSGGGGGGTTIINASGSPLATPLVSLAAFSEGSSDTLIASPDCKSLYVSGQLPRTNNLGIVKITLSTGAVSQVLDTGMATSGLVNFYISADSQFLYVTMSDTNVWLKISTASMTVAHSATLPVNINGTVQPGDLSSDGSTFVFLSDAGGNTVYVLNTSTYAVTSFTANHSAASNPCDGIGFLTEAGNIYVSYVNQPTIDQYTVTGSYVGSIATGALGNPRFQSIRSGPNATTYLMDINSGQLITISGGQPAVLNLPLTPLNGANISVDWGNGAIQSGTDDAFVMGAVLPGRENTGSVIFGTSEVWPVSTPVQIGSLGNCVPCMSQDGLGNVYYTFYSGGSVSNPVVMLLQAAAPRPSLVPSVIHVTTNYSVTPGGHQVLIVDDAATITLPSSLRSTGTIVTIIVNASVTATIAFADGSDYLQTPAFQGLSLYQPGDCMILFPVTDSLGDHFWGGMAGTAAVEAGSTNVSITKPLTVAGGTTLLPEAGPGSPSSGFTIYADTSDGNLKAISSTGTITVLNQAGGANFTILPTVSGGTGLGTIGTSGTLLGVNSSGSGLTYWKLVPTSPITITESGASITFGNTASSFSGLTGTAQTTQGGTGLTTIGASGTFLGVNATDTSLQYWQLTAGNNVTFVQAGTSLVISAAATGGNSLPSPTGANLVLKSNAAATAFNQASLSAGTGISLTLTDSNVTVTNSAATNQTGQITSTSVMSATSAQYNTVNATTGSLTISLPAGSGNEGLGFAFIRIDGTANTVTINVTGGANISGAASQALNVQYKALSFMVIGGLWYLI